MKTKKKKIKKFKRKNPDTLEQGSIKTLNDLRKKLYLKFSTIRNPKYLTIINHLDESLDLLKTMVD